MASRRFYLRGTSALGILNTIMGFLFNVVLVVMRDEHGRMAGCFWDKATSHPQEH